MPSSTESNNFEIEERSSDSKWFYFAVLLSIFLLFSLAGQEMEKRKQ